MTMKDAVDFSRFYIEIKNSNLPIQLAFKLNKVFLVTSAQLTFYEEQIQKYIDVYAERDENGNPVTLENGNIMIKPEEIEICNRKIKELENLEFDVPVRFNISEFSGNFTPASLLPLMSLIDE